MTGLSPALKISVALTAHTRAVLSRLFDEARCFAESRCVNESDFVFAAGSVVEPASVLLSLAVGRGGLCNQFGLFVPLLQRFKTTFLSPRLLGPV